MYKNFKYDHIKMNNTKQNYKLNKNGINPKYNPKNKQLVKKKKKKK